jgi:arylsulfatase A-like enzyme
VTADSSSSSVQRDALAASEWNTATFLQFGVATGILAGLVEAGTRLWLQSAGGTNFEMRLTVLGWPIAWIAPIVYAGLFGAITLGCRLVQPLAGGAAARQIARVSCFSLVFLSPLGASGRLQQIPVLLLSLGLAMTVVRAMPKSPESQARLIRRALPWLAIAVVLLFVAVGGGQSWVERRQLARLPAPDPAAPNIVVIVLDALRADHVSSYGYSRDTTPSLTQVARDGAQFTRAIATSSWTLPTHVSLLTGHYPSRHGAIRDRFDNRMPTLAAALVERGYRTGAISANTVVFSRAQGFGEGFLRFDDSFYSVRDALFRTYYLWQVHKRLLVPFLGWSRDTARRTADNVTASAIDWIGSESSRPFFLMLNYYDMHDPYVPPQPWRRKFSTKPEPGGQLTPDTGSELRFTAEEIQDEIDAYDGAIAYADEAIGRLLEELDRRGLRDRTVVVVTSDHGESLGQHGLMWHGTSLYFEQIHVPLLIRLPGRVPAGTRIDTPVSHASLPATLLELAGGRGAVTFPQKSLSDLWSAGGAGDWPAAVSELPWVPFAGGGAVRCGSSRSLVAGDHHLIDHAKCAPELYDLRADPGETRNLAPLEEYRQRLDEMRIELNQALGLPG